MKKTWILFLLILLAVTSFACAESFEKGQYFVECINNSKLREEPTADSPVIRILPEKTVCICTGEENHWFKVFTSDGAEGYIVGPSCELHENLAFQKDLEGIRSVVEITDPEPGTVVLFGTYEQDQDLTDGNEPIEWIVLDTDETTGSVRLISRYGLDTIPVHNLNSDVTWRDCMLRKWLNGEFVEIAFSADEQALMMDMQVFSDLNGAHKVSSGPDTVEKVTLLSLSEARTLAEGSRLDICPPTVHAVANGCYCDPETMGCWWWLRTPGRNRVHNSYVDFDGRVSDEGYGILSHKGTVRPVILLQMAHTEQNGEE